MLFNDFNIYVSSLQEFMAKCLMIICLTDKFCKEWDLDVVLLSDIAIVWIVMYFFRFSSK